MEVWFAFLKVVGAAVAGLALFLYGLEHFSREVKLLAGERTRALIAKITNTRVKGVLVGAITTAVLQSSTSVSIITIGLVDAGALTFAHAVPVVLGANIGTTITTQLVALRVLEWGAVILALGFLASMLPGHARHAGKLLFYFGFVFFGLSLISDQLQPIAAEPWVQNVLRQIHDPYAFVAVGLILSAVVQSSSVTTGLAVVLVQTQFIAFDSAVGMVIGANAGTTVTTWIASRPLDVNARRVAWAHILFNLFGVLLFLPFLLPFVEALRLLPGTSAARLANGHAIFNIINVILALFVLRPFIALITRVVPDDLSRQ